MPGVLMAEYNHDDAQPARVQEAKQASKSETPLSGTQLAVNGAATVLNPSGLSELKFSTDQVLNGVPSSPSGEAMIPASLAQAIHNLPPDIEHITVGYQPLSKLYERVSQECFNGLNDLINTLGDAPNPFPQVNGNVATNSNDQTSSASAARRLKWINFADEHRQRYIKLLVLNKWSKNSSEVSKLIDLHVWAVGQFGMYEDAALSLGELKRNLDDARLMRPDIETALEILTAGKSSRMPELNYILPEPLSPQKLLKTLRNINTLLAIRLNLHEDLPRHFNTFSISSGRATFTVPSEFEVDLSIASEDPSKQLYFVDFRFAFAHHSEIPAGQLRNNLEHIANATLGEEGLAGLFSFLHDFVLTHKLNLLTRQAFKLSRDAWSGSLKVEQVQRSLVLHYWIDRPGHKSWIEIGVSSGKLDVPEWRKESQQSRLAVRWMRNGKEVKNAQLPLDPDNLCLEDLLKSVTAQHISYILSSIRGEYQPSTRVIDSINIFLKTSDSDPTDIELQLPLTSKKVSTVLIEPVTGRFALQPPTSASARCETYLNNLKEPAIEACSRIRYWQAVELRSIATTNAERFGWKIINHLQLSSDILKSFFGPGVTLATAFRGKGWSSNWAVMSTITTSGQSWWAVELSSSTSSLNIISTMLLPTHDEFGAQREIQSGFFDFLDDMAISLISFTVLSRQLKLLGISYTYQHPLYSNFSLSHPTLIIRLSPLLKSSANAPRPISKLWAVDFLQFTIRRFGYKADLSSIPFTIEYVVKGKMNQSTALYSLLQKAKSTEISLDQTGSFAMAIKADLGQPILADVVARLQSLAQLRSFLATLDHRNFVCVDANLHRVSFDCGTAQRGNKDMIRAEVLFKASGRIEPKFISMQSRHPFDRIHTTLLRELDNHSQTPVKAFDYMVRAIKFLLPLLRALDKIEDQVSARNRLLIHSRSLDQWSLTYRQPARTFRISLKNRRGRNLWHVEDLAARKAPQQPASVPQTNGAPRAPIPAESSTPLQAALDELYNLPQTPTRDWHGLHRSIAAGIEGIEDALATLDEVVRSHTDDPEEKIIESITITPGTANANPSTGLPNPPSKKTNGKPAPAPAAGVPRVPAAGAIPAGHHARNISVGKMAAPAPQPQAKPNGGSLAPQKRKLQGLEVVQLDD